MSFFNQVHSQAPASTASFAINHRTPYSQDKTIRRLHQHLLSQSKEIFELTQENQVMRTKLEENRSNDDKTKEIIELRKTNNALRYELDQLLSDEEKDAIDAIEEGKRARQKRGPHFSGRERALLVYRRSQQLALNAQRERERAELVNDDVGPILEERVESAYYGMLGLNFTKVSGEDLDVSGYEERSLSME